MGGRGPRNSHEANKQSRTMTDGTGMREEDRQTDRQTDNRYRESERARASERERVSESKSKSKRLERGERGGRERVVCCMSMSVSVS